MLIFAGLTVFAELYSESVVAVAGPSTAGRFPLIQPPGNSRADSAHHSFRATSPLSAGFGRNVWSIEGPGDGLSVRLVNADC